MERIIYVCSYCGTPQIAEGDRNNKSPRNDLKCEICNRNEFWYVYNEKDVSPRYNVPDVGVQIAYPKNIKQWAENKTNVLREKGELPTPKCPTCGCTNIRRISGSEKVGSAMLFGYLGNKRKYQFQCQNPQCKYMW